MRTLRSASVLAILSTLILSSVCFAASSDPMAGAASNSQRPAWAVPENGQGLVPAETMFEHLTLVLKRSPQQQKAFENFLKQLQDRSSPSYHHFLSPVQIGQRFGVAQTDIASISEWLRAQGLRVDSVANSRMMINFSGTAAQVGAAFATELSYYLVNGERRIAPTAEPVVPPAFAGVIQAVSGLYTIKNRPHHATARVTKLEGGGYTSPDLTFGCPSGCLNFIMPADFATIYDLNGLTVDGTGQTIGIIGRSRVFGPDITNFQSLSGLTVNASTPTTIIPPDGVDPGAPAGEGGDASGDQGEATLDVQRSTSTAPGATIDLIVSASTETEDGIAIAAQYAVDNNPVPAQIISISFGLCEAESGVSDYDFWDSLFSSAAGEGISVFVSSGDSGAAGCDAAFQTPPASQSLGINNICASSYATCVGGTEFNDVPEATYWNENATEAPPFLSALGPIPEGAWNEPFNGSNELQIAGGGGGVSVFNTPTPSWQTGTGVPAARAGRYVPDVAFSSAAHDGYFGCLAGGGGDCVVSGGSFGFISFSGTSAAAPSMAGIAALLNQQETSAQGWLNQELYTLAATPTNLVFNDVTVTTSGVTGCVVTTPSLCNNSTASPTGLTGGLAGYLVTAGYDEATGWGSIDVGNLLTSWANTNLAATTTALVSSANPAIYGAPVILTATVTNGGAAAAPTGTVTFKNGTTTIGTPVTLSTSSPYQAALTTSTLPVGSDSITAVYGGDSNNGSSTSNTVTQVITAPAFAFTSQPSTPAPAAAGTNTTSTFSITPTGTTTLPITFACNDLPDTTITCSATPIPAGSTGLQTVTLTLTTSGPNTSSESNRQRRRADNRSPWLPLTLPLAGIVMVSLAGRRISRYSAIAGLCVSLLLLGLLLACGSTKPVAISVSPAGATVWASGPAGGTWPPQTANFTATLSNTNNTGVTWAVTTSNGGSITSDGTYTAPTIAAGLPTSATIMATSQADTSKTATATVTITPTSVPGVYSNLTVTATEGPTQNVSSKFSLTVQ